MPKDSSLFGQDDWNIEILKWKIKCFKNTGILLLSTRTHTHAGRRGKQRLHCHLASEELFSRVAEDVGAQEDPPGKGLAAVGADVGQWGAGPFLQQLGRRGLVGVLHICLVFGAGDFAC